MDLACFRIEAVEETTEVCDEQQIVLNGDGTATPVHLFLEVDLSAEPTGFKRRGQGIVVPMFADLKRHDMGPDLAEDFGHPLDSFFTTARLWGVADTAPYLHDGRATTLTEAIMLHGGEAEDARNAFAALSDDDRGAVIAFLRQLRTPAVVGEDLNE